jgi:hypothetical protein
MAPALERSSEVIAHAEESGWAAWERARERSKLALESARKSVLEKARGHGAEPVAPTRPAHTARRTARVARHAWHDRPCRGLKSSLTGLGVTWAQVAEQLGDKPAGHDEPREERGAGGGSIGARS